MVPSIRVVLKNTLSWLLAQGGGSYSSATHWNQQKWAVNESRGCCYYSGAPSFFMVEKTIMSQQCRSVTAATLSRDDVRCWGGCFARELTRHHSFFPLTWPVGRSNASEQTQTQTPTQIPTIPTTAKRDVLARISHCSLETLGSLDAYPIRMTFGDGTVLIRSTA
jgi:hypothetical protein